MSLASSAIGMEGNKQIFNDKSDLMYINHNENIYLQDDSAHTFYIIRNGYVKLSTYIDVKTIQRIPIGRFSWEIKQTCRTYKYTLAILKRGDFFGHEELAKNISRNSEAASVGKAELIYCNRAGFEETFDDTDIENLYSEHPALDLDKILEGISAKDLLLK